MFDDTHSLNAMMFCGYMASECRYLKHPSDPKSTLADLICSYKGNEMVGFTEHLQPTMQRSTWADALDDPVDFFHAIRNVFAYKEGPENKDQIPHGLLAFFTVMKQMHAAKKTVSNYLHDIKVVWKRVVSLLQEMEQEHMKISEANESDCCAGESWVMLSMEEWVQACGRCRRSLKMSGKIIRDSASINPHQKLMMLGMSCVVK